MSFFFLLFLIISFINVPSVMASPASEDKSATRIRTGPVHLIIEEEEEVERYLDPSIHVEKTLGITKPYIPPQIASDVLSLPNVSEETTMQIRNAPESSLRALAVYAVNPKMHWRFMGLLRQRLPSFINLSVLDLRGCGIRARHAKQLFNVLPSSLQNLQLEGNQLIRIDDECILPDGLQILNLCNTDLTDASAAMLLQNLPQGLLRIDMRKNDCLTDQGWVSALQSLEGLNLTHLAVGGSLRGQERFQSYEALVKTLGTLNKLVVFYLESFGSGPKQMDPLTFPKCLESLTLRNIPLSKKWNEYFAHHFTAPRLKYLCITSAGPSFSLCANFSNSDFFQVLDLSFNNLQPDNIKFLFSTLSPRIRYINMQGNQMTPQLACDLIKRLKQIHTPFTANLSGPYPYEAIKDTLPHNKKFMREGDMNVIFRPNLKEECLYGVSLGTPKPIVRSARQSRAHLEISRGLSILPEEAPETTTTTYSAISSAEYVLQDIQTPTLQVTSASDSKNFFGVDTEMVRRTWNDNGLPPISKAHDYLSGKQPLTFHPNTNHEPKKTWFQDPTKSTDFNFREGAAAAYPQPAPYGAAAAYPQPALYGAAASYPQPAPYGAAAAYPQPAPYGAAAAYPQPAQHMPFSPQIDGGQAALPTLGWVGPNFPQNYQHNHLNFPQDFDDDAGSANSWG